MSAKGLEILNARIMDAYSLAKNRLYRRRVTITVGANKGKSGIVQSTLLGTRGEIMAAIMVDNHAVRRGVRRPRLILPVGLLDIGDEEKLS
jgi:hypothetical protein